jgi:adenosylhomocysteinase
MCSQVAIQNNAVKKLYHAYADVIPQSDRQCMHDVNIDLASDTLRTFKNKRLLVNAHITLSTLVLIDALISAGADVMVTHAHDLVCHTPVLEQLADQQLYLPFHHLQEKCYHTYFDVVLDYGGYLANILKPKIGFVELTHVERKRYQNINSPVISLDHSYVKRIESSLGSGDGFVRAIKKTYQISNQDYMFKQYMIFGHGKVGRGIAHCLRRSGVPQQNIIVVEVRDEALSAARLKGYRSFNLINQYEKIKVMLKHMDCVVTATGITGAISRYFTAEEFSQVTYLANMGTYDEWGEQFSTDRVLYNKKPLNFSLDVPTQIRYLDPIFALMVKASMLLIRKKHEENFKIIELPIEMQKEVVETWIQSSENNHIWQDVQYVSGPAFEAS